MLLVFICVGSPTSSAIAPRSLQAALRHARKTNTINSNSELWKTNTTTTKELSSSCTLHQPLGCGCACGECTFLHYIPIPKTGSEATKTWLGLIQGGLDSTYPPGASAPRLCANKSVCYLGPSTHEANKRLPQLPGSLGAPLSKPWWAQAHSPSCASLPGTRQLCARRDDPQPVRTVPLHLCRRPRRCSEGWGAAPFLRRKQDHDGRPAPRQP